MHMVHSLSLLITLFDFVGHPIFQASYCKNIESNHQTSEIVDSVIWGLTSLLVTTLLKLMLKPSAFSDSHKSYPFLYNTSKKRSHMVQTLGPNLLISSFLSSVLSAPNAVYPQHARCRRTLLDAVQQRDKFVGVALIAMLIRFIPTSLVSYTKKEIFYLRNPWRRLMRN